MAAHRCLFAGITLAIWIGHKKALRAGGYDFAEFWRSAWGRMTHAWRAMSPAGYAWEERAVEHRGTEGTEEYKDRREKKREQPFYR